MKKTECAWAALVSLSLIGVVHGGALESTGPKFDPAPVEIPTASTAASHTAGPADLLTLRDLHGISISPDGTRIAFVVGQAVVDSNSYRSGLFVVGTTRDSVPVNLGSAGDPHWDDINQWSDDPPKWSLDSKTIYYRTKTAGSWQVWRWPVSGGAPAQVTHVGSDVTDFQLAPGGEKLVLTVEKPLDQAEITKISEQGILYDGSLPTWNLRPILEQVVASKVRKETWIHNLQTNDEHVASEVEEARYGPWVNDLDQDSSTSARFHGMGAQLSPDGRDVVYLSVIDSPAKSLKTSTALFVKPVRGGNPIELTPEAKWITEYWWRADSQAIYYAVSTADGHSRRLMTVMKTGGTPRQLSSPAAWLDNYSVDGSGQLAACTRETNTTPAQVAVLNLSTGKVNVLVDLNPQLKAVRLSSAQRIDFTNKYGDHFHAEFVLPPDHRAGVRYPLIVTTYRSGDYFLRGASGDEYPIQVFAAHGFAVLSFDAGEERNTLPGDFETKMLRWDSPIEGMRSAISDLTKKGVIDPSKVGITGLSYGAELVAYAISHSDLFQAASSSSDGDGRSPYFYYMGGRLWHAIFADWGLGGWPEGRASPNWHRLSVTLNADKITAPLLMNVADSEYFGGLDEVTALEQLGKPAEMFVYADELHMKNQPAHRREIYERNVDWFRFWLKSEEDTDPAKAAQYERWRKLKIEQVSP